MPSQAHRIRLDVFEGMENDWVDIHDRRTFGVRSQTQGALTLGIGAWNVTRMQLYVSAWSLPGDPKDRAVIEDMDDEVAAYVLKEAEAHYERNRRTPAERKSPEGAAGASLQAAGDVA